MPTLSTGGMPQVALLSMEEMQKLGHDIYAIDYTSIRAGLATGCATSLSAFILKNTPSLL